jgi:hypothetical protein
LALLFVPILAGALPPDRAVRQPSSARERGIAVMSLHARVVNHDRFGTNWVFHGLNDVAREVEAAAVTRMSGDRAARTYVASELVAPGEVFPGKLGQVYSISPLTTPGYYAATIGYYSKERATRNALVVFHESESGELATVRVIRLRNAAQVIGGPRDTMVVSAVDPLNAAAFHLATVFDVEGNVHAELLPFGAPTLVDASRVNRAVRLQQSGADDFALYDPQQNVVQHFSLAFAGELPKPSEVSRSTELRQPRRAVVPEIAFDADWAVDVAASGIRANDVKLGRLFDFDADDAHRTVTVARNVLVDGRPVAAVTRYDGRSATTFTAGGPWNGTLWRDDAITGFAPHHRSVLEERVSIADRIAATDAELFELVAEPRMRANGCASWMNARQCAQANAPDLSPLQSQRFRIQPLENGGGEGCMSNYDMCAHSVQECMDYYKQCNADFEGNTYWMNCSIDYCMYDSCYDWSCSQDRQKICCPDEPPETTVSVGACR